MLNEICNQMMLLTVTLILGHGELNAPIVNVPVL